MNKQLLSLALLFAALTGFSQAFSLVDKKGAPYASGHKFTFDSYPDSTIEYEMFIKNLSSAAISIEIDRFDDALNKNQGEDTSYAYFCTGDNCLTPEQTETSISLGASEELSFKNYFKEASDKGYSAIRYKFVSGNETQEYTFIYNLALSVKEQKPAFEMNLFPNPAAASVRVSSAAGSVLDITVSDLRGVVVKKISGAKGETDIDVSGFAAGLYLVSVNDGKASSTRKLQVLH